jgi:hypothetical protein
VPLLLEIVTPERLVFSEKGTPDVDNLFARFGKGAPHLCFAVHADVSPVLKSHFQSNFDRGCTAIGIKNTVQTRRGNLDESFSQFSSRDVRHAQHGRMGNVVELSMNGLIEFFFAMAVNIQPYGREPVIIFFSVCVDQLDPFSFADHQRILCIIFHLRKGQP